MALANRAVGGSSILILLGIISGALFYGDAIITPALSVLSVLSAIEGLTSCSDFWGNSLRRLSGKII
jgi:KUP system potassium uptake protein